ncbi:50S ribosomal protein L17 [Cryomorphaceae bacterium]|nr:50S ribosomal protein L17 [Cryomorphaceae bacterium]
MRHGKKFNHLGRTAEHRKAMLANMASSLIEHKRINTTVAKAKALKKYIEPLITKSKTDTTHSRRVVFSQLKNKEAVTELFREVAVKVANRPGGYTRIIRTGNRLGDNAEMCLIELVDFNELYTNEKPAKKKRSRRGSAKKTEAAAPAVEETVVEEVAEETTAEAVVEEAPAAEEAVEETAAEEAVEEPAAEDQGESEEEKKEDKAGE